MDRVPSSDASAAGVTSSLSTSLEHLSNIGHARVREEHDRDVRRHRRARVRAVVEHNHGRRTQRDRDRERAARAEEVRLAKKVAEAKAAGRAEAADACAEIEEGHRRRMRELNLAHDIERMQVERVGHARGRRFAQLAMVACVAWVVAVFAVVARPAESTWVHADRRGAAEVSHRALPAVSIDKAVVVEVAEEKSTVPATRKAPRRVSARTPAVRPRQPAAPAPAPVAPAPAAPMCDDTSGDPCCAFGEIVC